jgi:hypothetical protein
LSWIWCRMLYYLALSTMHVAHLHATLSADIDPADSAVKSCV